MIVVRLSWTPRPITHASKRFVISGNRRKLEFHSISAVAGDGVKDLVRSIANALDKIPRGRS